MTCPNCGSLNVNTHNLWTGSRFQSGFLCGECGNKFSDETAAAPNLTGRPAVEMAAPESETDTTDLESLTVIQLRDIARDEEVSLPAGVNKAEIIGLIEAARTEPVSG